VSFQFDYSLTRTLLLRHAAKKDASKLAGRMLTSRLGDLAAITPGGFNEWSASSPTRAPAPTWCSTIRRSRDTVLVYVGDRPLPGTELAEGGPGGWSASGSPGWLDRVQGRGQPGALGPRDGRTDFAPTLGTVTFDSGTRWYFNASPAGLPPTRVDFLSVAIHELGHVLGFGTAIRGRTSTATNTFNGRVGRGVRWPVPLHADHFHWAENVRAVARAMTRCWARAVRDSHR
jgi:hypothetical protein